MKISKNIAAAILFILLSCFSFATTFSATLKNGTNSTLPAAYIHFQLYNCGLNAPVIASSPSTIAASSFDLTPNQPNGSIIGTVVGNDNILCGNVQSTQWIITEMTADGKPYGDSLRYVICDDAIPVGESFCSNTPFGVAAFASMQQVSTQPPPPGFNVLYSNPKATQTWTQPVGTFGQLVGDFQCLTLCQFDFTGATLLGISGGGGGGTGVAAPIVAFACSVAPCVVPLPTTFTTPALVYQCWDQNNIAISGFSPTLSATTPYTVTFTFSGIQSGTCTAVGAGTASPPPPPSIFSVMPTALAFPNVPLGSPSSPQTVNLTNNSGLTISSIVIGPITGTNAADYSVLNTSCGSSLAPLGVCSVSVILTPSMVGNEGPATLTITDSYVTSPQTVSLSGSGTGAALLSILPPALTFASQAVGSPSTPQVITVTNVGTAPAAFTSIVASGDYSDTTTCSFKIPLPQTQSCTVSVVFTPTTTGTRTGAITFTDSAVGSPQAVTLTGTGTANNTSITSMAIAPTSATVNVGQTQQFTGTATLSSGGTINTPLQLSANWNASGMSAPPSWAVSNSSKCSSGSASSCAMGSVTQTINHVIVVFEATAALSLVPSAPTDTPNGGASNTYVKIGSVTNSQSNTSIAIYTTVNSATGANTITCNYSGSTVIACAYAELAGAVTSNYVDSFSIVANGQPATATANIVTPSFSTSAASDAILCFAMDTHSLSVTAVSPYTSNVASNSFSLNEESQLGVTGSFTCPFTDATATTTWTAAGVAIVGSGGTGADASVNSTGLATGTATGSSNITVAEGVYQQGNFLNLTTNVSTISQQFSNPQGSGNLNVVVIGWGDTTSPTLTVTDTSGNCGAGYTQVTNSPIAGTALKQAVFYCNGIIGTNSPNLVTVASTGSLTTPSLRIYEYTIGVPGGSVLDASVSSAGTSTCGTAITTVSPPDLIISACTAATAMSVAPAPLIQRCCSTPGTLFPQDADNAASNNTSMFAAAGAQTTNIAVSASGHFVNSTIAFKAVNATAALTVASSSQNTYYISASGSDSNDGTSLATPWLTFCHADATLALGTNGTQVVVLPGTYVLANQGSCYSGSVLLLGGGSGYASTSSTAHVTWTGLNDPRASANSSIIQGNPQNHDEIIVGAKQYVDILNFEWIGSMIILGTNDNNVNTSCNFCTFQYNYGHDQLNQCIDNLNGIGGFITTGMVTHDVTINANVINNIGVMGGCSNAAGDGPYGIYLTGYHSTVTNNLVSNAQGGGLSSYHDACESNITNNTLVHNYTNGMLISAGPQTALGCGANGGNYYTLDNNLVYLNSWGCGVTLSGNPGIQGGIIFYNTGSGSNNNHADNNYMIGNFFGSGAGCTGVQGGNNSYVFGGTTGTTLLGSGTVSLAGLPTLSFRSPCPQSTWGTGQGPGGTTPPCNVIPKARGGTYDWSPITGSTFIGAGGSGAAGSPGFSPPVVPTYDINGILRTSPTSVGAYE